MDVYHGLELDPPVKTRFAELETPISVLIGERDFQGSQLWARRLATQAPNADLTVIPAADHMPMFSTPEEFQQFVTRSLAL
ncbi:alpha/beta hydrolase [Kribbella sp. NBC_00359]